MHAECHKHTPQSKTSNADLKGAPVTLTREQIIAIRHLLECARYGLDENGEPLVSSGYVSLTEQSIRVIDRLLMDAEADNTRRERPRLVTRRT